VAVLDWEALMIEIVAHLRFMVSRDTSAGNETVLARHLQKAFREEGLWGHVHEPSGGRGSFVGVLPGGGEAPLVLLSHLDTAPADDSQWPFPPHSGELRDGVVYGRGAVDCKGLVAAHLGVIFALKRVGARLDRCVYMVSAAGEEEGGEVGTASLLEAFPSLRSAAYVLGEGGGYGFDLPSGRVNLCQVGEKGRLVLRVRSRLPTSALRSLAQRVADETSAGRKRVDCGELRALATYLDLDRICRNVARCEDGRVIFETMPGFRKEEIMSRLARLLESRDPLARVSVSRWEEGVVSER